MLRLAFVLPICAVRVRSRMRPFYKWRSKFGGMGISDAKRLRQLDKVITTVWTSTGDVV